MRIQKDVAYTSRCDSIHKIDLYLPDGECRALLVYLHGGGLVEGSRNLDLLPGFAKDMTDVGIAVASAGYRLYPEAKYPDFIEDAAHAVAYAKSELLGIAGTDKLFVCGTSAGAYLTMMLCFDKTYLGRLGLSPTDIDGFNLQTIYQKLQGRK